MASSRSEPAGAPPDTSAEERRVVPLTEPMYLILAVLADGPLHGYGILGVLDERSRGEIQMLTGTLYNALRRLEAHGLVEARDAADSPQGDESVRGPRRTKSYRATTAGLQALRDEARRMRSLLRWSPTEALEPVLEEGP